MAALQEFTFPVQVAGSGSKEYITRTSQFGDGYSQVVGEGIHESKTSWSVAFTGYKVDVDKVISFLDDKRGYKSFAWRDPLGVLGNYRATKWSVLPHDRMLFTLTTEFEQAFTV